MAKRGKERSIFFVCLVLGERKEGKRQREEGEEEMERDREKREKKIERDGEKRKKDGKRQGREKKIYGGTKKKLCKEERVREKI